jgi:hypothetical protein
MTPPPAETIHLPFDPGPFRMAMNLVTVPEPAWFEIDDRYAEEMAERRALMRDRTAEVFAAEPSAAAACAETLAMVSEHLLRVHPAWFEADAAGVHDRLTGWRGPLPSDPLVRAGLLVQEDLCLIQESPDGPRLTAGVLCFPTRWRLTEKVGRPLADVHGGVPFYAERLARPVDRFMTHLKPSSIAARLNWSVIDNGALFQPTGKWNLGPAPEITAANAGDRLFLRVERQTLRRLPVSDAVLFGIRVHSYPLRQVVRTPDIAARLAAAVRALPEMMARYKSLPGLRLALLAWLDERAG